MDKEKVIKQLDNLKDHCEKMKNCCYLPTNQGIWGDDVEALKTAIASLEVWDKVKEELEKEMNEYENVLSDLSYSDGIGYALAVIEEHLKEIEE